MFQLEDIITEMEFKWSNYQNIDIVNIMLYEDNDSLIYKIYPYFTINNIYKSFKYLVHHTESTKFLDVISTYVGCISGNKNYILYNDINNSNSDNYALCQLCNKCDVEYYIALCIPKNKLFDIKSKHIKLLCKSAPVNESHYFINKLKNIILYDKFRFYNNKISTNKKNTNIIHEKIKQIAKINVDHNMIWLKSEYDCLYGFTIKVIPDEHSIDMPLKIIENVEISICKSDNEADIIFRSESIDDIVNFNDITIYNPIPYFLMNNPVIIIVNFFNNYDNIIDDVYVQIDFYGYNINNINNINKVYMHTNIYSHGYNVIKFNNKQYIGITNKIGLDYGYELYKDVFFDELNEIQKVASNINVINDNIDNTMYSDSYSDDYFIEI